VRLIRNLLAADSVGFNTAPRSEVARFAAGESAADSLSPVIFYEPGRHRDAGLAHDPFKALVAPRPIGWVSTMSDDGLVNLAPYSFFNAIGEAPPMLAFSSKGAKDSATFAGSLREFVWNLVTFELREQMNETSAPLPRGHSEFERAGLAMAPSQRVAPPRVAAARCAMECKVVHAVELHDLDGQPVDQHLVIGQVVGIHLDESAIVEGAVDTRGLRPVARLGGPADYTVVDEVFRMTRPIE
jgi:flavin reductase (DIM6/NTAB) family NADH-FMN oxidoreductase RutF